MKKGTTIKLKSGLKGVLKRVHGSVFTFGKIDKEGRPIMTRACNPNRYKQKCFIMRKETLKALEKAGDLEYV